MIRRLHHLLSFQRRNGNLRKSLHFLRSFYAQRRRLLVKSLSWDQQDNELAASKACQQIPTSATGLQSSNLESCPSGSNVG